MYPAQLSNKPGRLVRLTARIAASFIVFAAANARAQDPPPPAGGLYTAEQAQRGDSVFTKQCLSCHERKDYSNPDFQLKWQGRTVFELFERVRTTMPDDNPGALPRETYADLIAYLLKLNGMPTGNAPLPADSAVLSAAKLTLVPPPSGAHSSAHPASSLHLSVNLFRGR